MALSELTRVALLQLFGEWAVLCACVLCCCVVLCEERMEVEVHGHTRSKNYLNEGERALQGRSVLDLQPVFLKEAEHVYFLGIHQERMLLMSMYNGVVSLMHPHTRNTSGGVNTTFSSSSASGRSSGLFLRHTARKSGQARSW